MRNELVNLVATEIFGCNIDMNQAVEINRTEGWFVIGESPEFLTPEELKAAMTRAGL